MVRLVFIRKLFMLVCMVSMMLPLEVYPQELQYPLPCYQGDELAKVREWESTWAGRKISSADVDKVKELLPASLYELMKNTERWKESWFTIVPYQEVPPSPGNIKFTKQYYGHPKVGANGELLNWVSGVPFPTTNVGIEMAHNFRSRTFGDGYISEDIGWTVDGRLKYDMSNLVKSNYCFFAARLDTPPAPEFSDNPKQIWRAYTMLQLEPPETRDMRIMEIQYKDQMKAYDSWMWVPTIRRVRRRSTSERQDPQGGSDFCSYDNSGWDGPVQINTYKYLGAKDFLMARHTDKSKLVHTPGDCLFDGVQRERVRLHMVEAINEDTNFLYSKQVWYIDPETWSILYADKYDRKGNLWKVYDQYNHVTKGHGGVPVAHNNALMMVDIQRLHSTIATTEKKYGVSHDPKIFDYRYLQKYGF